MTLRTWGRAVNFVGTIIAIGDAIAITRFGYAFTIGTSPLSYVIAAYGETSVYRVRVRGPQTK